MDRTYTITRPVLNTYLSRERDRRRRRELAKLFLFILPVGLCGLVYVSLRLEVLRTGYRTHQLEQQLVERSQVERRLTLESSHLASPLRIETLAVEKLGMSSPNAEQLLFAKDLQ